MMDEETKKLLETKFETLVNQAAHFSDIILGIQRRVVMYGGRLFEASGDNDWAFVDITKSGAVLNEEDRWLTSAEAVERALDFLMEKAASGAEPKRKRDEDGAGDE